MRNIRRKYRDVLNVLDTLNARANGMGLTDEEIEYRRHCIRVLDYLRDRLPSEATVIEQTVFVARSDGNKE